MTRQRNFGSDTPFGAWVRSQDQMDSRRDALVVHDIDWTFHKYCTPVDGIGTRELELSMMLELKTHGAKLTFAQQKVLFFTEQLLKSRKPRKLRVFKNRPVMVWHYGVHVLELQNEVPKDGDVMRWGVFQENGALFWHWTREESKVAEILGFLRDPRNPRQKINLKRHHKNRKLVITEMTNLGFEIDRIVDDSS